MLSAAIAATLLSAGTAAAADFRTAETPIAGQYIVVLKDDAARLLSEARPNASVATVASRMAATHRVRVTKSFNHVVRGFVAQADDRALARLLADPRVAYVEEDGIVTTSATQSGAT